MALKMISIIVSILAFSLAGCDTFSHIRTDDDKLEAFPPRSCIERALRNTPGVEFISFETTGPIGRTNDNAPVHLYNYLLSAGTEKFSASVLIDRGDKSGIVKYSNNYSRIGSHLAESEKKLIPPILARVDNAISEACGIKIKSSLKMSE
jgi:hypothetical protein